MRVEVTVTKTYPRTETLITAISLVIAGERPMQRKVGSLMKMTVCCFCLFVELCGSSVGRMGVYDPDPWLSEEKDFAACRQ